MMDFSVFEHIIPYVRMTRKGKYVNERAQAYLANQDLLKIRLKEIMRDRNFIMLPPATPMSVKLVFYRLQPDMHTSDLDNLQKAVCDSMNKIVYPDDRWIDHFIIDRKLNKVEGVAISVRIDVPDSEYNWDRERR